MSVLVIQSPELMLSIHINGTNESLMKEALNKFEQSLKKNFD